MSAFKRKIPPINHVVIPGTRQNLSTSSVLELSTGIPSFDDILGGGLPLGSILVVLAPDPHAAWGDLVQKYFIAQGLVGGQGVCVVGNQAEAFVQGIMWLHDDQTDTREANEDEEKGTPDVDSGDAGVIEEPDDAKVKIAWRYDRMKKFQTSVPTQTTRESFLPPVPSFHHRDILLMQRGVGGDDGLYAEILVV